MASASSSASGASSSDVLIGVEWPWARDDKFALDELATCQGIKLEIQEQVFKLEPFDDLFEFKLEPFDDFVESDSLGLLSDEEEKKLISELGLDSQCGELTDMKWGLASWQDFPAKNKIRRPGNGFIKYTIVHRKAVAAKYGHKRDNRFISKMLGIMWRKLSPEEKSTYVTHFDDEMKKIRESNPEWNYAASRAKIAVAQKAAEGILPERLRNRNKKINYNVDQIMLKAIKEEPEENPDDLGASKQRRKKAASRGKKTSLASKTVALNPDVADWVRCDVCQKWRKLEAGFDISTLPRTWICWMNSDPVYDNCDLEEEEYPD